MILEELLSCFSTFVLQRQSLVEHEAPTPRVTAQGRTQGLADVEFKLEAAEEFHGSLFYTRAERGRPYIPRLKTRVLRPC